MSPNAASSCVARAPHVPVPFGYAAVDKKIVVIPAEAEAVRTIFARYFELGSVVITAVRRNRSAFTLRARATGVGM